jgi:hypothetical protein
VAGVDFCPPLMGAALKDRENAGPDFEILLEFKEIC